MFMAIYKLSSTLNLPNSNVIDDILPFLQCLTPYSEADVTITLVALLTQFLQTVSTILHTCHLCYILHHVCDICCTENM